MGPLDYTMDVANPLQMALQGYQFGAQMRAQQQAQQAAQAKAQAMASLMKPGVTFGDYQRTMQAFPDEAKALLDQWKSMNEVQQGALFNSAGEAYSLLQPGADGSIDPARAVAKLEEYAVASENSGDKDTAQKLRDMASVVRANPMAGRATIGVNMAMIDGERFKAIAEASGGEEKTADQRKYEWLVALKGREYADRWLAVESEKFVPVPGVGVYRGSDLLRQPPKSESSELPPSAVDVPPPQVGENGLPTSLTPDQYRVTVEAMGKDRTDKWMADNGIKLAQPPQTATINGRKFYKINGQWFDNPEGR